MATILRTSNVTNNAGVAETLAANDLLYVAPHVAISGSTDAVSAPSAAKIRNYGFIFGQDTGIRGSGVAANVDIMNGAGAFISGDLAGVGFAGSLELTNFGEISNALGDAISANSQATFAFIENYGTIRGGLDAIDLDNTPAVSYSIRNFGTIIATSSTEGIDAGLAGGSFDSTLGDFYGIFGGSNGVDIATGGRVSCTLLGGGSSDVLYANPTQTAANNRAKTILRGDGGNNALYGGGGFNVFQTGAENVGTATNQIWGGKSLMNDIGGYLNNTLELQGNSNGMFVDLLNGHNVFKNDSVGAWDGTGVFEDWVQNVPNVVGTNLGDLIQADGTGGTIRGAGGADQLFGAPGADIFRYEAAADSRLLSGYDTIVNFQRGIDKIDVSEFMRVNGLGPTALKLSGSGNSTTVYLQLTNTLSSTTDLAFIVNSTGGVLGASDFIL